MTAGRRRWHNSDKGCVLHHSWAAREDEPFLPEQIVFYCCPSSSEEELRLKQLMLPRCGREKGLNDEASNHPELMLAQPDPNEKVPRKVSDSQSSV